MSRSDAEVLEAMREQQLNTYLDEYDKNIDNYDACFEKIDNESAELCQELIEIVKKYSDKYRINELDILKDMIYPTLEAGVAT